MSGRELLALIAGLLRNPASQFHAAVAGWKHPLSREAMQQLDLMDLLLMRWTGKNFKALERPWGNGKPKRGKSPDAAMRQLRPHLFPEDP